MNPVEVFRNWPGFVRLDGPDKVPAQVEIGQFLDFSQRLLQVVFAEFVQAKARCPPDFSGTARFTDRKYAY